MSHRKYWLKWMLVASLAMSQISIYCVYYQSTRGKEPQSDIAWQAYWKNRFCGLELAIGALNARVEGRTVDFNNIVDSALFDEKLHMLIRYYEKQRLESRIDYSIKGHLYSYVINLASDPFPPDSPPFGPETIGLFRRIALIQANIPTEWDDPEIEDFIAQYIRTAIQKYEAYDNNNKGGADNID